MKTTGTLPEETPEYYGFGNPFGGFDGRDSTGRLKAEQARSRDSGLIGSRFNHPGQTRTSKTGGERTIKLAHALEQRLAR